MLPLVGSALAKAGMGSQLMGLLNIGGAVGGLSMLPMAFGVGQPSEEEQERMLRRQLEIQDEFERSRAGGEMGDLGGLVGGGGMSLEDLMAEELLTRKAARAGRALERFEEARPKYMDELDKILAGQTARIASLQSERTLTPLEIISMVEGGFG